MPNWDHVLREIQKATDVPSGESAADKVRKKYLMELNAYTGRNVIGYYSGFLSKPKIEGVELVDEDKNGFMLAIHKLDKKKGLDLFIHTPGGNIAATESLVDYIRKMFGNNVRAFVPQIAMSAGTMLACSCKEIWMGTHSNLGPVDPSVNGIQAHAVLAEIELALRANDQRPESDLGMELDLISLHPIFRAAVPMGCGESRKLCYEGTNGKYVLWPSRKGKGREDCNYCGWADGP